MIKYNDFATSLVSLIPNKIASKSETVTEKKAVTKFTPVNKRVAKSNQKKSKK